MTEPKIAALIGQLDSWKLDSEEESLSPSPGPSPDTRMFQKYELEMQIASLSKDTSAQEALLKAELNDLEVRLTILKSQRKSDAQAFSLQQERFNAQLHTSEESVRNLTDQLATLESQQPKKPQETQENDTFSALKIALKPLYDATKALESEKSRLQALSDTQEMGLSPLREGLMMLEEDARSRAAESEQAQKQRDFLQKKLTDLSRGNEEECGKFMLECKTRDELGQIVRKKTDLTARLSSLQQRLAECIRQEQLAQEKLGSRTPQSPLLIDIGKIERSLSSKSEYSAHCSFNQLLGDISRDHSYNIEVTIIKEQVHKVEERESQLLDQWKSQRDQDRAILESLSPQSSQYQSLKSQMDRKRQVQSGYESLISTWKQKVKSALTDTRNAPVPIPDTVFRSEFQKRVVRLLPEDEKAEAIRGFDRLLEGLVQPQTNEGRNLRGKYSTGELNSLAEEYQGLQYTKTNLEAEKIELQKELFALSSKEKELRAVCDQGFARNQSQVHKSLAESYTPEEYAQILKTFGKKAVFKMSKSTKISQPRSALQSKFEELYRAYQLCEQHSDGHQKNCDTISERRKETKSLYDAYMASHAITLNQIEAVAEAEEELRNRTEAITETKLQEIRLSSSRSRSTRDSKMQELTAQIYKWHEKASELRIRQTESMQENQQSQDQLSLSESELTQQRLLLTEQLQALKVSKQQVAGLEKQLRDLEQEETVPLKRTHSCTQLDMSYTKNEPESLVFSEAETGFPDVKLDLSSAFQTDLWKTLRTTDFSASEIDFFKAIQPLLEGGLFYKKFSQKSSLVMPEFDPLEADTSPPEKCGYGFRELKLNKALTKIEIRQPGKPGIESSIMIEKLLDPVIPKHSLAILRTQKNVWLSGQQPPEDEELKGKYQEFKRMGIVDFQSPIFEAKCMDCQHYVFFLALEKGGRVELVADSYALFKHWLEGVKAIVKNKKQLPKLKFRLT